LFVALYSGGVDAVFLKDLATFHAQFVDSKKSIIFGDFWRALAEWDVQTPLLKIALLKIQYVSSKINKYKEPTLVLASDLNKMAKMKAELLDSEKLFSDMRALFKEAGLDGLTMNMRTKILGQLDCMVARFTCGKQDQSAVRLESLSHAKRQVLEAALKLEAWKNWLCFERPWPSAQASPPKPRVVWAAQCPCRSIVMGGSSTRSRL